MRVYFPNARIPLTSNLIIKTDQIDTVSKSNIFLPLFIGVIVGISVSIIVGNIFIGLVVGAICGTGIYYLQRIGYNKHRVQLENIEFEKLFDVRCDDQITSRMIITPAFMDRLVTLVKKTGNRYEFLLQNNIMYIKRQITGTYLEAGTEKNMLTNLSGFVQFYTDMREIIQFTFDMNLMYLSKTDTSQLIKNQNEVIPPMPVIMSLSSLTTLNPILKNILSFS
jgi:hypothetical protein